MEEKQSKNKGRLNTILNKYYRLFSVLIFLIIVFLGVWFLIWPEISKSQKMAKEFLPAKMEEIALLGKYTGKIKDLETLVSNIDSQYGRSLDLLRQVLPTQANVPELIAQVDALTRKSGFEMNSIDITESSAASLIKNNPAINSSPLRLVNINLSVSGGSYPNFKILLDNIEKNIRLLDLNSVSFAGGTSEIVNYTLNLRTYYFTDSLTVSTSTPK